MSEILLTVMLNTNKTDHRSITELVLTVASNTNKTDHRSKWVSDCCLEPTQQFFPAISWREQVNIQWDDDEVRFVLDQQLSWISIVLDHWHNSPRIDIVLDQQVVGQMSVLSPEV